MNLFPRAPSVRSLMDAIWNGEFGDVAQTQGFFDRVKYLRHCIDKVYLLAETRNVYLPEYITSAQKGVVVARSTPLGVVGRQLELMPSGVGPLVSEPRHRRQGSRLARRLGMASNF